MVALWYPLRVLVTGEEEGLGDGEYIGEGDGLGDGDAEGLGDGEDEGDGDGLNDGDAEGEGLGVGETMGDTPLIPPVLFDTGTIGFLLEGPEAEVEVALTGTVEVAGV